MAKGKTIVLDTPVQFGKFAPNKTTGTIGVRFSRESLDLERADSLCNHRLTGALVRGRTGDSAGQKMLVKDAELRIDGVFDVKRFSFNRQAISTSLQFSIEDIDLKEMCDVAFSEGRLIVEAVAEIPEEAKPDKKATSQAGAIKADGPWRKTPLDDIFPPGAIRKCLAEASIDTMGQLADWSSKGNNLTDIKGIGVEKATQIEDAMERFFKANPDARDQE